MKTLPALATISAAFFLTVGISCCNAVIIGYSTFLLLLVLPALCYQIYEMIPAYKRKHQQEMKDFSDALHCIEDLEALSKNKTEENIKHIKANEDEESK